MKQTNNRMFHFCWHSANNTIFFYFLQKRNMRTNILLVCYPALLCILIVVLQNFLNEFIKKANNALPKQCDPKTNPNCPTPEIPKLPPLLQVPEHPYRAVRTDFIPFTDLPDESCRRTSSCPATILLTGNNRSLGESITFFLPLVCVCVCACVLIKLLK